jgi:hypothetical protein
MQAPLRPPEGVATLDCQMDREDAEFRQQRMREAAARKVAQDKTWWTNSSSCRATK